jgi:hypothetical protein
MPAATRDPDKTFIATTINVQTAASAVRQRASPYGRCLPVNSCLHRHCFKNVDFAAFRAAAQRGEQFFHHLEVNGFYQMMIEP